MTKQIIPRDQWERLFADLSREYTGKSATLEVLRENVGPQLIAYDQPFGEIGPDGQNADRAIAILLGETFTHTIAAPLRISAELYDDRSGQVVEIESASGPPTRLYLSHSAERSSGRGEIYGAGAQGDNSLRHAEADQEAAHPQASVERAVGSSPGGAIGPTTGTATPGDEQVLGIGIGGVSTIGGGSLGDRDLSGRRGQEIADLEDIVDMSGTTVGPGSDVGETGAVSVSTRQSGGTGGEGATGHSFGGDVDVVDPGGDVPVLDSGADPIGGLDDDAGDDRSDDMVEGDVGAQAERDLSDMLGERDRQRKRERR